MVRKLPWKFGKKGSPGYVLAECLMLLLPVVTQVIENVPNELVNLAKEISRQNAENASGLLLAVYDKSKKKKKALSKHMFGF